MRFGSITLWSRIVRALFLSSFHSTAGVLALWLGPLLPALAESVTKGSIGAFVPIGSRHCGDQVPVLAAV
jgi:hypothetical protein